MEKNKTVLGIHDGHNASVALLVDGKITYAFSEERLARVKNKGGFPKLSIKRLLSDSDLTLSEIDLIAFCHRTTPKDIFYDRDKILERYRSQVFPEKNDKKSLFKKAQRKLSHGSSSKREEKTDIEKNNKRLESLKNIGDYDCEVFFSWSPWMSWC